MYTLEKNSLIYYKFNAIVALESSKEQFQPVIDLILKTKAAIVMSSYRSNDN